MSKTRAKKADKLEPKYRLKQLPDGSTVQVFQRGLHEVIIGPAGKHTPESRWRREIMLARANELLAQHGIPSFQSIVASGDGNMEKTDILINAWIKSIGVQPQLGLFASAPFVAASFLALDHLVCSDVVARVRSTMNLTSSEPSKAVERRSQEQVGRIREYANAWHWWHMEVFGEHADAADGEERRGHLGLGAKQNAAELAKAMLVIAPFCDALWAAAKSRLSSLKTARNLLDTVNAALKREKHPGYSSPESLAHVIRKIRKQREAEKGQVLEVATR